jgi:hypothetical protein
LFVAEASHSSTSIATAARQGSRPAGSAPILGAFTSEKALKGGLFLPFSAGLIGGSQTLPPHIRLASDSRGFEVSFVVFFSFPVSLPIRVCAVTRKGTKRTCIRVKWRSLLCRSVTSVATAGRQGSRPAGSAPILGALATEKALKSGLFLLLGAGLIGGSQTLPPHIRLVSDRRDFEGFFGAFSHSRFEPLCTSASLSSIEGKPSQQKT